MRRRIHASHGEEDTYLASFAIGTCEAKCQQTTALAPVDHLLPESAVDQLCLCGVVGHGDGLGGASGEVLEPVRHVALVQILITPVELGVSFFKQ